MSLSTSLGRLIATVRAHCSRQWQHSSSPWQHATCLRPRLAVPPQSCWAIAVRRPGVLPRVHPPGPRAIHIPTVLYTPVYYTGLLLALWTWKCMMMVVFQNKIIYMPGVPPNARSERIADYAHLCGGIQWSEEGTRAADGTDIAMAVATISLGNMKTPGAGKGAPAHAYVLCFHGNASSIPPRLPDISWVLRAVSDSKATNLPAMQLTFVCLSYRGYWTSRGRPSEKGFRLDAEAGVQWIAQHHESKYGGGKESPVPILLVWGQSIGSGVATNLAATGRIPEHLSIQGMILETPFLNVRAMLETLYPQKWLPYRYLWPFLRNHLDSWENLGLIASTPGEKKPFVYIMEAKRDELVPREHTEKLFQRCLDLDLPAEKETVPFAYHTELIARGDGKRMVSQALVRLIRRALGSG